MSTPDWHQLLLGEIAKSNVTQVARQLGYARTTISLVAHRNYPGSTDKVRAKVLEVFANRRVCPHTNSPISIRECETTRCAPIPTSNAKQLRHWTACRSCPFAQADHERTPK